MGQNFLCKKFTQTSPKECCYRYKCSEHVSDSYICNKQNLGLIFVILYVRIIIHSTTHTGNHIMYNIVQIWLRF